MGLAITLTIQALDSPKQGRHSHTTTVRTLLGLVRVTTRRNDLLVRLDAWTLSFVTILYQNIPPAHQVSTNGFREHRHILELFFFLRYN